MSKFKVGDRVKVVGKEWSAFAGVTGVVTEEDTTGRPFIKPDKDRPDGFGRDSFFWAGSDVELVALNEDDKIEAALARTKKDLGLGSEFESVLNKPEYVMPELPKTGDYVRVTYVNGDTHEAEVIGLRDSSRICPFYNIHFSDGRWTVVPVDAEAYKQYSKDEPHNVVVKVEHIERPIKPVEIDGYWIARKRGGRVVAYLTERDAEQGKGAQTGADTVEEAEANIADWASRPYLRQYIPMTLAIIKYIENEERED